MSDFLCECGCPLDEDGFCPAGCTDAAVRAALDQAEALDKAEQAEAEAEALDEAERDSARDLTRASGGTSEGLVAGA